MLRLLEKIKKPSGAEAGAMAKLFGSKPSEIDQTAGRIFNPSAA